MKKENEKNVLKKLQEHNMLIQKEKEEIEAEMRRIKEERALFELREREREKEANDLKKQLEEVKANQQIKLQQAITEWEKKEIEKDVELSAQIEETKQRKMSLENQDPMKKNEVTNFESNPLTQKEKKKKNRSNLPHEPKQHQTNQSEHHKSSKSHHNRKESSKYHHEKQKECCVCFSSPCTHAFIPYTFFVLCSLFFVIKFFLSDADMFACVKIVSNFSLWGSQVVQYAEQHAHRLSESIFKQTFLLSNHENKIL